MAENISSVSDESFEEEVLKSELPVLVDFWAGWCAPCLMIAPTLENIAQVYKEKMRIKKLNVDENPRTAAKYGIMSIPTLLLFKEGKLKETIIGALPQDKIIEVISKHI